MQNNQAPVKKASAGCTLVAFLWAMEQQTAVCKFGWDVNFVPLAPSAHIQSHGAAGGRAGPWMGLEALSWRLHNPATPEPARLHNHSAPARPPMAQLGGVGLISGQNPVYARLSGLHPGIGETLCTETWTNVHKTGPEWWGVDVLPDYFQVSVRLVSGVADYKDRACERGRAVLPRAAWACVAPELGALTGLRRPTHTWWPVSGALALRASPVAGAHAALWLGVIRTGLQQFREANQLRQTFATSFVLRVCLWGLT